MQLLRAHHGPAQLQVVPDHDAGDWGIEAYSLDGCAYQCYAVEGEPLSTKIRLEKQRDKLTTDLRKLTKNDAILTRLFSQHGLHRWIFLVPLCDSKRLILHATTKQAEIRALDLNCTAPDFTVLIHVADDYPIARRIIVEDGLAVVPVRFEATEPAEQMEWQSEHTDLVHTMLEKLSRVPTLNDEQSRREMVELLVSHYISGANYLERLKQDFPNLWQQVEDRRLSFERSLRVESKLAASAATQHFQETLRDYRERIEGLLPRVAADLSLGATADWLMRCPLEFKS